MSYSIISLYNDLFGKSLSKHTHRNRLPGSNGTCEGLQFDILNFSKVRMI